MEPVNRHDSLLVVCGNLVSILHRWAVVYEKNLRDTNDIR